MSVTRNDVLYMAGLARLQLDDEEVDSLQQDMNKILEYIELLDKVNTENVEPLEHVIELQQNFRKDEALKPLDHDEAMKNAPDTDGDYFRVPRVIE